jgi:hypothetical protein
MSLDFMVFGIIVLLPHDPILSILGFFEKSSQRLKVTFTSPFHLTLAHSFLFGANRDRIFANRLSRNPRH